MEAGSSRSAAHTSSTSPSNSGESPRRTRIAPVPIGPFPAPLDHSKRQHHHQQPPPPPPPPPQRQQQHQLHPRARHSSGGSSSGIDVGAPASPKARHIAIAIDPALHSRTSGPVIVDAGVVTSTSTSSTFPSTPPPPTTTTTLDMPLIPQQKSLGLQPTAYYGHTPDAYSAPKHPYLPNSIVADIGPLHPDGALPHPHLSLPAPRESSIMGYNVMPPPLPRAIDGRSSVAPLLPHSLLASGSASGPIVGPYATSTNSHGNHMVPQLSTSATASHLSYPYPAAPAPVGVSPYYDSDPSTRARSLSSPYSPYSPPNKKNKHEEDDKRTRRKEQNRLAQQDLRRRRLEHAQFLEQKVVELNSHLEAQSARSAMLEDLCQRLQVDNQNLRAAVSALKGEQPASVVPPQQLQQLHGHSGSTGVSSPTSPTYHHLAKPSPNPPLSPFAYERPRSSGLHASAGAGQTLQTPTGAPYVDRRMSVVSGAGAQYVDRRMSVVSGMDGSISSSNGVTAYGAHLGAGSGSLTMSTVQDHNGRGLSLSQQQQQPSAMTTGYSAQFEASRNLSATPTLSGSASSGYSDPGERTLLPGYVYGQ